MDTFPLTTHVSVVFGRPRESHVGFERWLSLKIKRCPLRPEERGTERIYKTLLVWGSCSCRGRPLLGRAAVRSLQNQTESLPVFARLDRPSISGLRGSMEMDVSTLSVFQGFWLRPISALFDVGTVQMLTTGLFVGLFSPKPRG
jgi:hypothetical protein